MKVACPACFWATDDIEITLTDTKHTDNEMNMLVKCNRKECGKQFHVVIQITKLSELVPV